MACFARHGGGRGQCPPPKRPDLTRRPYAPALTRPDDDATPTGTVDCQQALSRSPGPTAGVPTLWPAPIGPTCQHDAAKDGGHGGRPRRRESGALGQHTCYDSGQPRIIVPDTKQSLTRRLRYVLPSFKCSPRQPPPRYPTAPILPRIRPPAARQRQPGPGACSVSSTR